jgi:hypothetical protein
LHVVREQEAEFDADLADPTQRILLAAGPGQPG